MALTTDSEFVYPCCGCRWGLPWGSPQHSGCDLTYDEVVANEARYGELEESHQSSRQYLAMSEWLSAGHVTCPSCDRPRSRSEFSRAGFDKCIHCGSRGAKISTLPRDRYKNREIADRDGWTCALCGRGIDKTLTDPYDPGYLNIDHIIPVTAPDFPGDILSNVQATHRLCNIKKGGFKQR